MLLWKKTPAPARAGAGLWWQPKKIAVCRISQSYYTVENPSCKDLAKYLNDEKLAVAVSPEDVDGKIWYIAFDVDSGRKNNLESIYNIITKLVGDKPLISRSGGKGWHVWLFPDKPLEKKIAVDIAEKIADQAGVLGLQYIASDGTKRDAVEIFPAVDGCLKLPGQPHPVTGEVEEFVDIQDEHEYDTATVWGGLVDGMWRIPAEKLLALVPIPSKPEKPKRKPRREKVTRLVGIKPAPDDSGIKIIDKLDDLACLDPVALSLTPGVSRIGQGFHCVLPGHEERRKSAAWYRMDDGHIMYHDFHCRDGEEWYSIPEVYHAIRIGRVQKLGRIKKGHWLAMLGLKLGYRTPVALGVESLLPNLETTRSIVLVVSRKRRAKYKARARKGKHFDENDRKIMSKILDFIGQEAMIQAMGGFWEIALSVRFLAENVDVSLRQANRAMNLLCILGVLEKVPGTGSMAGDRYILSGKFDPVEARRRWDMLGRPSLRALNRSLVEKAFGKEFAGKIFRRSPEK